MFVGLSELSQLWIKKETRHKHATEAFINNRQTVHDEISIVGTAVECSCLTLLILFRVGLTENIGSKYISVELFIGTGI